MVGLKRLIGAVRCDEWPKSSKALWAAARCTLRPGQFLNNDIPSGGMETIGEMEYDAENAEIGEVQQFHWDMPALQLGTDATLGRAASANQHFRPDFLRCYYFLSRIVNFHFVSPCVICLMSYVVGRNFV